jgi:hypothetical protein
MMSDKAPTAQGSAATVTPNVKFKDMSFAQKIAHVGKALLFVLTLGFCYPNLFAD